MLVVAQVAIRTPNQHTTEVIARVERGEATAELLVASGKSLRAFVTYDKRLAAAAGDAALPVATPS